MAAAPLAMLGAVAVAGLTTYLARPARRSSAIDKKRQALIAYLRDHLSGSDVAIARGASSRLDDMRAPTIGRLFRRLAKEFEEDRSVVSAVLRELGASGRSMKRVGGRTRQVHLLSFAAGGAPGDLSLLRTLEALSIGVQGKRCMWRALQNLRTALSTVTAWTSSNSKRRRFANGRPSRSVGATWWPGPLRTRASGRSDRDWRGFAIGR